MKSISLLIGVVFYVQLAYSQKSISNVHFIAGFPDYMYCPVEQLEIYESALLIIEEDSLIESRVLTDSMQFLCFLRNYPMEDIIICMVGNKQNASDLTNFKDYSFVIYNTKNQTKDVVVIPNECNVKGIKYVLNSQSFNTVFSENRTKFIMMYTNLELPKDGSNSRVVYCAFDPISRDFNTVTPEVYQEVVSGGNSFILKNNNEGLLLLGDIDNNTLKIPTDKRFYKSYTYINNLPEDVEIKTNYYAGKVLINNEQLLVLYLYEKEKLTNWNSLKIRVYDKKSGFWSYFVLNTSIVSVKSFDRWLGGNLMVRDFFSKKNNNMLFKKDDWIKDKSLYGPSYPSLLEADESYKFYSKGDLYLYNVDSKVTIKWTTGHGDSEILLVQKDEVYYRVNDEIYWSPIINDEELGNSKLLVKDARVNDIHWAFPDKE